MKRYFVLIGMAGLTLSLTSISLSISNSLAVQKSFKNMTIEFEDFLIDPAEKKVVKAIPKKNLKKKNHNKIINFFEKNQNKFLFFENKFLANNYVIEVFNDLLENLSETSLDLQEETFDIFFKKLIEKIEKYFSYFKFSPGLVSLTNELLLSDHSRKILTPLVALQNFLTSSDIIQLKQNTSQNSWFSPQINLLKIAKDWSWDDFYQYQAGVNFNYMFKVLNKKSYFGDLITKNISYVFNKKNFFHDVNSDLNALFTNKEAWPYLFKAFVPLLKTKLLACSNSSSSFENLTWEQSDKSDLSLKLILTKLRHLFSEAGKEELINLVSSLLTGPFSEDIIFKLPVCQNCSLSEVFDSNRSPILQFFFKKQLNANEIAKNIVSSLLKFSNNLNVIFDEIELLVNQDLKINLKELNNDLKVISSDEIYHSCQKVINIIKNPNIAREASQVKEILKVWGIQPITEDDFKANSMFFILKKWLERREEILNFS